MNVFSPPIDCVPVVRTTVPSTVRVRSEVSGPPPERPWFKGVLIRRSNKVCTSPSITVIALVRSVPS